MGGKNKSQESRQYSSGWSAPWAAQEPYLKEVFQGAQNFYQGDAPFAPFSDISTSGFDAARQLFPQTTGMLSQTVGGEFMGANPYLQDIASRAQEGALSGINATFGGAGRTGGGIHQQSVAEGLGNVAAGIYAPAYEAERSRMMQASGMIPRQLAGQVGLGGVMEAKDLEQQLAPYTQLQRYLSLVGGNYGSQSASRGKMVEPGRDTGSGVLGGAMTGAQIGSVVPGVGTGIGALIGGIGGGLGVI
ncbi:hypothetical protein [Zhongshania sp.]|uniref:hypothetical protein n=1 Tax=Zhongshania sp. TaxID=1971902 RepID=UPI00356B1AEC